MCLAMPMQISEITGTSARCKAGGLRQTVRIDFVPDAKPGDYVMVHAGFAIQKLSDAEAQENIALLEELRHAL